MSGSEASELLSAFGSGDIGTAYSDANTQLDLTNPEIVAAFRGALASNQLRLDTLSEHGLAKLQQELGWRYHRLKDSKGVTLFPRTKTGYDEKALTPNDRNVYKRAMSAMGQLNKAMKGVNGETAAGYLDDISRYLGTVEGWRTGANSTTTPGSEPRTYNPKAKPKRSAMKGSRQSQSQATNDTTTPTNDGERSHKARESEARSKKSKKSKSRGSTTTPDTDAYAETQPESRRSRSNTVDEDTQDRGRKSKTKKSKSRGDTRSRAERQSDASARSTSGETKKERKARRKAARQAERDKEQSEWNDLQSRHHPDKFHGTDPATAEPSSMGMVPWNRDFAPSQMGYPASTAPSHFGGQGGYGHGYGHGFDGTQVGTMAPYDWQTGQGRGYVPTQSPWQTNVDPYTEGGMMTQADHQQMWDAMLYDQKQSLAASMVPMVWNMIMSYHAASRQDGANGLHGPAQSSGYPMSGQGYDMNTNLDLQTRNELDHDLRKSIKYSEFRDPNSEYLEASSHGPHGTGAKMWQQKMDNGRYLTGTSFARAPAQTTMTRPPPTFGPSHGGYGGALSTFGPPSHGTGHGYGGGWGPGGTAYDPSMDPIGRNYGAPTEPWMSQSSMMGRSAITGYA